MTMVSITAKLVLPQHSPQPGDQAAKQHWESDQNIHSLLNRDLSPQTSMKEVGGWSYSSYKAIETNAAKNICRDAK